MVFQWTQGFKLTKDSFLVVFTYSHNAVTCVVFGFFRDYKS